MRTANQLTFTTYEASLKLRPNDPTKVIFDNIDWSFVHSLVKESTQTREQRATILFPCSRLSSSSIWERLNLIANSLLPFSITPGCVFFVASTS